MVDFSEFSCRSWIHYIVYHCRKEFGAAAEKMFVDLKSILNAQLTDAGKIAFTTDMDEDWYDKLFPWCYCPFVWQKVINKKKDMFGCQAI